MSLKFTQEIVIMAPPEEKEDRIDRSIDSEHTASSADKADVDIEKGGQSDAERTEFNEDVRASRGGSLAALSQRSGRSQKYTDDGRRIMQEEDCWDKLGYQWPTWKKVSIYHAFDHASRSTANESQWMLLTSIFSVQYVSERNLRYRDLQLMTVPGYP